MPAPKPWLSINDLLDPGPPYPTIILLGCQPDLLPPQSRPKSTPCPVCGGRIGPEQSHTYCAQCDLMSPANEDRARGARLGLAARDASEVAAAQLRLKLKKKVGKSVLSEVERRRMWNGYRGSIGYELAVRLVGVYGADYRAFLTRIGQEPAWDKILDRRGNVIGRRDVPEPEPEPADVPA